MKVTVAMGASHALSNPMVQRFKRSVTSWWSPTRTEPGWETAWLPRSGRWPVFKIRQAWMGGRDSGGCVCACALLGMEEDGGRWREGNLAGMPMLGPWPG